jgi:TRAP-type mannitol/chloroaromatic compound transport system permease small subunit
MKRYIRIIEALNHRIGRIVMYGIFVLMAILLWSSVSKTMFLPSLWTLEMAQFVMVGYYILGGPYSIQLGSNVRMDLLYGEWSLRRKAWFDLVTVLFLIFYLGVLIYGGIASTAYSLGYWGSEPLSFLGGVVTGVEDIGHMERSSSAWRPYLWPIKLVLVVGLVLMLLQCTCELFKDVLRLKGETI